MGLPVFLCTLFHHRCSTTTLARLLPSTRNMYVSTGESPKREKKIDGRATERKKKTKKQKKMKKRKRGPVVSRGFASPLSPFCPSVCASCTCKRVCVTRSGKKERDKGSRDTKNGCSSTMVKEVVVEEEEEERRTTTRRRTRREEYVEADRRKISRGTHGRSVLVAGGWRIGRVAMEKRAGGIPRVRRLGPPQRETPIREIRGVATPNLPRCRRFSSAWLIDSATNQRPRRSSTSSSPPLCFSSFTARVSLFLSLSS